MIKLYDVIDLGQLQGGQREKRNMVSQGMRGWCFIKKEKREGS